MKSPPGSCPRTTQVFLDNHAWQLLSQVFILCNLQRSEGSLGPERAGVTCIVSNCVQLFHSDPQPDCSLRQHIYWPSTRAQSHVSVTWTVLAWVINIPHGRLTREDIRFLQIIERRQTNSNRKGGGCIVKRDARIQEEIQLEPAFGGTLAGSRKITGVLFSFRLCLCRHMLLVCSILLFLQTGFFWKNQPNQTKPNRSQP